MVEDLGTSAAGIQLMLSAYFVGIALGQLVFGPLSDRHGRRGPLLAGLVACTGASVACALAPSVEWLVAARFVQAFTGAAGMVISRAIVPDIAQGKAAARAFSLIFMVLGIAPVIAPILGGALAGVAGWRAIFWTYAALVLATVVTVRLLVPESNPRERREQARDSRGGIRPLAVVLGSRAFVGNTLAFALSFAALMAYMAASPFVFQVMGGLGPVSFGTLYGAIAVVLIASSAVSARMARSHEVCASSALVSQGSWQRRSPWGRSWRLGLPRSCSLCRSWRLSPASGWSSAMRARSHWRPCHTRQARPPRSWACSSSA